LPMSLWHEVNARRSRRLWPSSLKGP